MDRSRLIMLGIIVTVGGLGLVVVASVALLFFRIGTRQVSSPADERVVIEVATVAATPVPTTNVESPSIAAVRRNLRGAVIPLPDSDSARPDLLIFNQNLTTRANTLLYLNADSRTIRWESPPLSERSLQARVVADRSVIYVADQTDLLALDRGDGSLLWKTVLSDTIFTSCRDCMRVVGENLVVLTQDGMLQSFDGQNGEWVWQERLRETPRQLLVIGEQVAVLDHLQVGRPEAVLHIFDPANGTLVRRIEPVCPDPEDFFSDSYPSIYTPVYHQPETATLYLMFGSINSCAQRLDATSGAVIWRTDVEDLPPTWNDGEPLLTEDAIYIGDDELVVVFDAASGELRRLSNEPDYSLQPLAVRDGTLVVEATRTRGSRRTEVWGIDAVSGVARWRYVLQNETGADDWAWHLTPAGVAVIQKFPTQVRIDTLDLRDGSTSGQATINLDDRITIWRGVALADNIAYLTFQRLYAIDLTTGEVVYTWP